MLVNAVDPIPTVAWFRKVLRLINEGFMARVKLETGGGFVQIEKSTGDARPGSEFCLWQLGIEWFLTSLEQF